MDDGRKVIEEVYKIIKEISEELESKKQEDEKSVNSEFEKYMEANNKWVKKCRNKVWLRSKEGTDLAKGCLDTANKLKENKDDMEMAPDLAADLSFELESLAKVIASKASVMT